MSKLAPASALLTWQPPATSGTSSALLFDVIRSGNRADFVGGTAACLLTNDAGTQATDSVAPAPGAAFYYLARAENACGAGIAGTNSSGIPIATQTCP